MTPADIVVTGVGAVSPLGNDLPATWAALIAGRSGAAPITRFDPTGYETTFAAEVKGFDAAERLGRLIAGAAVALKILIELPLEAFALLESGVQLLAGAKLFAQDRDLQ